MFSFNGKYIGNSKFVLREESNGIEYNNQVVMPIPDKSELDSHYTLKFYAEIKKQHANFKIQKFHLSSFNVAGQKIEFLECIKYRLNSLIDSLQKSHTLYSTPTNNNQKVIKIKWRSNLTMLGYLMYLLEDYDIIEYPKDHNEIDNKTDVARWMHQNFEFKKETKVESLRKKITGPDEIILSEQNQTAIESIVEKVKKSIGLFE